MQITPGLSPGQNEVRVSGDHISGCDIAVVRHASTDLSRSLGCGALHAPAAVLKHNFIARRTEDVRRMLR
jgi:hypothetical protein